MKVARSNVIRLCVAAARIFPATRTDGDPSRGRYVLNVEEAQHRINIGFVDLQGNQPTLLELLKKSVSAEDGIYPSEGNDNLFLIPADDQLDTVQDYLSNSGVGATLLKRRIEPVTDAFQSLYY